MRKSLIVLLTSWNVCHVLIKDKFNIAVCFHYCHLELKTTIYIPDNDLTWEYETDWTRSASSDMRTFSTDVRM